MPGFGAIKHDEARLARTFLDAQEILAGISLPVGFGMALLAEELLSILVGTKWLPATLALQLLVISVTINMLTIAANGLVVALGNTRLVFFRSLATLLFAAAAIWIGIREFGFIGAGVGVMATSGFTLIANLTMVHRFIHVGMFRQLGRIWRSLVAIAAMCAAVLLARPPFDPDAPFLELLLRGAVLSALGAVTYVAVHALMWRLAGRPKGFEENILHYGGRAITGVKARMQRPRGN